MISYELRDDVAWITIERPEKANAVNEDGWRALEDAVERAGEEARAAVISGEGEDAFCAGDDIAGLADAEGPDDLASLTEAVYGAYHGIELTPVPVIAAIDGVAFGGGLEVVIACDLAVASERSTFSLPEGKIGAYPPFAVERIRHAGGTKRMMELILTGDVIDAETALEWGLLNRVVPAEEVTETVESLLDSIMLAPKRSTRFAKRYANADVHHVAEEERMVGAFAELYASGDLDEGVRSFFEGTEPAFRP